ncbi:MAG: hypothetical protein CEE40_11930 [Chloroflexi bacterium B3_Chlor]|nr:MAG: hypothetical protein CEE40_11930 [Chloroflexi bacterium B3_Chlor]
MDVPEYLIERARGLIANEKYRDLSSFVAASMENQLTLEERTYATEPLTTSEVQEEPALVSRISKPTRLGVEPPRERLPTVEYGSRPNPGPVEQWPWGQINKLLPVKFTVRLLANQLSDAEPVVPLDHFKLEAAQRARSFGLWLAGNDKKYGRRRDERLSAGFPIGRVPETSLNRYATHFVGHERKNDKALFGALFELKLGNAEVVGTKLSVGLTEAGVQFATIPNPVLDNSDLSSSLGNDEIGFYLEHIRARVPGEAYAFELILGLLAEGVNGREGLNERVRNRVGLDWTDAVVNMQRTGTMARMYELGLIEKTRDGLRVKYGITDRGMSWLTNRK